MNATRYTIQVSSTFEVTGYNPEMADFDNPQGADVEEVFHLEAVNNYGERRTWGAFRTFAKADAAIALAPPVHSWEEGNPVYGSQAYQDSGEEQNVRAWERANDGPLYGLRSTATVGYQGGF